MPKKTKHIRDLIRRYFPAIIYRLLTEDSQTWLETRFSVAIWIGEVLSSALGRKDVFTIEFLNPNSLTEARGQLIENRTWVTDNHERWVTLCKHGDNNFSNATYWETNKSLFTSRANNNLTSLVVTSLWESFFIGGCCTSIWKSMFANGNFCEQFNFFFLFWRLSSENNQIEVWMI